MRKWPICNTYKIRVRTLLLNVLLFPNKTKPVIVIVIL